MTSTTHLKSMKLFNAIATAAVIGGSILVVNPVNAQYRQTCSSDLMGGYNCRDNNGGRTTIQSDMLGGYTIRNGSTGQRCSMQSDMLGGYTTRCY